MKEAIRAHTPKQLRSFLIRLGRFYGRFPSQKATFEVLRSLGWQPKRCIDIGAYHGEWATTFLALFPESEILMIEGQPGKQETLASVSAEHPDHLQFAIALLGATDDAEVEFIEMETGSSIFEEDSPFPRRKTRARLKRLDSLIEAHPDFRASQMLKLDTQGYELEILRGAETILENAEMVLLEASFLPINRGAPRVEDVIHFMTSHGFRLFDFCSQSRRKDGVLWQSDLMFYRPAALPNLRPALTENNW